MAGLDGQADGAFGRCEPVGDAAVQIGERGQRGGVGRAYVGFLADVCRGVEALLGGVRWGHKAVSDRLGSVLDGLYGSVGSVYVAEQADVCCVVEALLGAV